MHPLNRLGAVVPALALLIGVPYVLVGHVTWPELPASWDVALAHLRGWRLPPGVLTAVMIVLLWALWGGFALALAAEAGARLRGVPLRLRPFGPLQAVAATAVAATVATPVAAFADTIDRTADAADEVPDAPAAEQGPVERTRTISGFEVGSAELTEQMRRDLEPTVAMLAEHRDTDVPVTITGHADPSGNADRNMELSRERARAVADHLAAELGENAPDTEVDGRGSEQPVEGPPESQRRVEVTYTLAPAPPPPAAPQEEPEETTGLVTAQNAASSMSEDGPRVVVLEIPDGAVAGAVGFAGLAGGYLLGRRGALVPRIALSLPRRLTGRPRRLALPPPPPRPEPEDHIDGRVTVELDHVPGLGLTGKGADGAARRLIANALDPAEPLAVRILITEGETVRLLGETGRDLLRDHPCEPVTMVPHTEDALAVLAAELRGLDTSGRAPLALITSPVPGHEHALSGLLLHGQHRGVTAVILGSWPLGGSCTVDADGLISQTSTPLSTLFHCSWAGATAEEVHEAVHAHHRAGGAPRPERGRPVLVPEDWDDDAAFVSRVGDPAAWDRLTRAWEEDEETDLFQSAVDGSDEEDAFPGARRTAGESWNTPADDGDAVDAAFRALLEAEGSLPADHTPAAEPAAPPAPADDGAPTEAATARSAAPAADADGASAEVGAAVPERLASPAAEAGGEASSEPADRTPAAESAAVPSASAVPSATRTTDGGAPAEAVTARSAAPAANADGASAEAGAAIPERPAVPAAEARGDGNPSEPTSLTSAEPGTDTAESFATSAESTTPSATQVTDGGAPAEVGAATPERPAVPAAGVSGGETPSESADRTPAAESAAVPSESAAPSATRATVGNVPAEAAAAPVARSAVPAADGGGVSAQVGAAIPERSAVSGAGVNGDETPSESADRTPAAESAAVPSESAVPSATRAVEGGAPAGAGAATPERPAASATEVSSDGTPAKAAADRVSPVAAGAREAFEEAGSGGPTAETAEQRKLVPRPGGRGSGFAQAPAAPAAPAAPRPDAAKPVTPAAPDSPGTEVRHERVPGRKAGRARFIRVERPVPRPQGETATPAPARIPTARTGEKASVPEKPAAAPRRPHPHPETAASARATDRKPAAPADGGETAPAYRPQPAKPRKAGRGRTWKPRGDA
ncbi:OmpA family protein [Nocardiopsis protaetiae]|uniref:OmpA family protein n=2 Tax=Nocardiopsidaceae TaxID=83676 RepID=UPI00387B6389